jgi:hypothetical protein
VGVFSTKQSSPGTYVAVVCSARMFDPWPTSVCA